MKDAPTHSGLNQDSLPGDYGMGPRVDPRLATAAGMTADRLRQFHLMRVTAWAEGRWRECRHGKCRKAKKCRGGARGTFARFGHPDCYPVHEAERFGAEKHD